MARAYALLGPTASGKSALAHKLAAKLPVTVSGAECYRCFADNGIDYGPPLRGLESIRCDTREALGRFVLPRPGEVFG